MAAKKKAIWVTREYFDAVKTLSALLNRDIGETVEMFVGRAEIEVRIERAIEERKESA